MPKTLKNGYFGQKCPNFDHFWPFWGSKFFWTKNIFGVHLSHMETQLYAKNKKNRTVKAEDPERMDGRTDKSEFLGSLSEKSGEPINSRTCLHSRSWGDLIVGPVVSDE